MTMSFIPEIKRNYTTQEIFLKPNFQKKNVKEEFVSTNSNINLKSLIKTDDENDRASQNILIDTESKKLKSEDTESIIDIYPSIIYSENEIPKGFTDDYIIVLSVALLLTVISVIRVVSNKLKSKFSDKFLKSVK